MMPQSTVSPPAASVPSEYAELAELAGSFIHEVKNHLSTLNLNLQLLGEDFQEPQSQRERRALERIHRLQNECQRLVEVSNDFLRFARLKELEPRPTDLAECVEEVVDFFTPTAQQANIEIKCFLPSSLPDLPLDRELFKQALLNLLLNAQQAMPQGGQITFQAVHEPNASPPCVTLSAIDTGDGMMPDVVARAFRPFFSTKSGGTGLGLATTRRIIEAHGGSISLQSEPGKGTKFTLRLPVAAA